VTHRLLPTLVAVVLAATACSYESSGTTTTTMLDPSSQPPPTGPADLVFEDQRIEGASVLIESLTLPAEGFIALYTDEAGARGELLGFGDLVSAGVIANVPVPFFVPIEEDTLVHAVLHIDMDRDGVLTFEPPDAFIDVIASSASGEPVDATAMIGLLPPVSPAALAFEEQRTLGGSVTVESVTLPAEGFVAVRADEGGVPGEILGLSEPAAEGTTTDLEIFFDQPASESGFFWVTAYIDRDGDGVLDVAGDGGIDAAALGADGVEAAAGADVVVVPRSPARISAEDQEGDGLTVTVLGTLPAPGFVVLRADDGGEPGEIIAVSDLLPDGTTSEVVFTFEEPLEDGTVLWARIQIDLDGSGEFDRTEPNGQTEGGGRAETSFVVTLAEPDDAVDGG
jgi:hypothetical protein